MHKGLLNAKVNLLFYFVQLLISFYSRKIFLEYLGAEFIGLTGTLQNFLNYLNLAELGIGGAISFNLYKPLFDKDYKKINDIISLQGYLYRKIAMVIAIAAFILSLFFPLIFEDSSLGLPIIYYAFFSLIVSTLLGYLVNYNSIVLSADQRNYTLVAYTKTSNIIILIVQLILLQYTRSLYLYLTITLVATIVNTGLIQWKVHSLYKWLDTSLSNGKELTRKYGDILTSTKQVFVHKIKDTIIHHSDQLFIFLFESLTAVAYYGNYTLLTSRVTDLANNFLGAFGDSVGNLVAEGDKSKIQKVFWELIAIRYFFAGCISFCIYHLAEPFISIWLGKEYLLSHTILVLIIANLMISQTRGVVDNFNSAYGNYKDTWSAWAEAIISIIITFSISYKYGLIGILIGKFVSTFLTIVLWKPIFLFREGLRISHWIYWRGIINYYLCMIVAFYITKFILMPHISIKPNEGYMQWVIYASSISFLFCLLYGISLLVATRGMKDVVKRLKIFRTK